MKIKVVELCSVDYIKESDSKKKQRNLTAKRTVIYNSPKSTLKEATTDYKKNFDSDNIIDCNDEFDGECLDTLKYLSFSETK